MSDNNKDTAQRPSGWMISCPEATRLSSERLDRKLEGWEMARYRFHLMICGLCRRYGKQMETLHTMVHGRGEELAESLNDPLGQGVKDRIKAKLRE